MKKVVKVGFNEYEILSSDELYEGEPVRFGDRRMAAQFLRRFARNPLSMKVLRDFVARRGVMSMFSRMGEGEVVERLAARLVSRQVLVVPRASIYVVASPEADDEPAAPPPQLAGDAPAARPRPEDKKKKTFIKFKVVDLRSGEPLDGVGLHIRLPDSTVVKEITNSAGMVEIHGIDPGTCTLRRMDDSDALEVVKLESGGG